MTMNYVFLVSELKWDESNTDQISSDAKIIGVFTTAKSANDVVRTWHQRDYVPVEVQDFENYTLSTSNGLLNLFASWQRQAWEISVEEIELDKEFSMSLLEPTNPGEPVQMKLENGDHKEHVLQDQEVKMHEERKRRRKSNKWTNPKSARKTPRPSSEGSFVDRTAQNGHQNGSTNGTILNHLDSPQNGHALQDTPQPLLEMPALEQITTHVTVAATPTDTFYGRLKDTLIGPKT